MNYKASKEAFVSGMTGSSVTHVNMISAVALSSVALHSALRSRLPPSKAIHFPTQWLILIIPLLLSMTVFANSPGLLALILLFPTGLLILIPPRESGTPLPSNTIYSSPPPSPTPQSTPPFAELPSQSMITPIPSLTIYRAHMLLMTTLAILSVDFPVFPRSLAKCETYGVSLMDLGVGSFVFSQGLVSAIPLLKDPSHLTSPMKPKIVSVVRKGLPIIVLGVVRVLLVKGTDYPEHETEYGTHWNFFITLALLPVLQVFLHPFITHLPVSMVGSVVALTHQAALSFGLEKYVLDTPRTTIFSANKEGIVSLTGYMAIHLLGLSTGTLLIAPSPSYFRRRQQAFSKNSCRDSRPRSARGNDGRSNMPIHRQNDKTATELFSYAAVWWSMMGLVQVTGISSGLSRRMVNLPYILWVAAFNTSFLLGYLLLDLYFFPSPLSKCVYSPTSKLKVPVTADGDKFSTDRPDELFGSNPPALLEAINKNGLVLFLVANVVTGLINLSIPTMYTSDLWAMVVLSGYALAICAFAWAFRAKRIWLM